MLFMILLSLLLLDQIWMSTGTDQTRSFVVPVNITDHFPVCLVLENMNLGSNVSKMIEIRIFSDRNKDTFKECLNSIQPLVTQDNKYSAFNTYYKNLFHAYNIAFPIINKRVYNRKSAPWMTDRLKECIMKKAKLYKLFLKGRIHKNVYTSYRNKLTHLIRKVKSLYYTRLFLENARNSKKVWDILNDLLNRKSKTLLDELKVSGVELKGKLLVDYINRFFINIALNIHTMLSSTLVFRCLAPCVASSCFFRPADIPEINVLISGLKNRGNRIIDIHPLLIKENKLIFSGHISVLYNLSL